jgi:ATP-binding cassette, subfamily B, bacterial MsbA
MSQNNLYRRMLRYVKPYAPYLMIVMLMSFIIVVAESLSLWLSASLVNTLFLPDKAVSVKPSFSLAHINEYLKYWTQMLIRRDNVFESLKLVCILLFSTFFLKNLLTYLKTLLIAQVNTYIIRDMRSQIFNHSLLLPVTYYDRNRSGQITSLVLNDAGAINNSLVSTFDKLIVEPLRLLFFVCTLFIISTKLTLMVFVIFPLLAFIISEIGKTVRRRSRRNLEHIEGVTSVLQETASCIRAVKMFNMAPFESAKFKIENDRLNRATMRNIFFVSLTSPLTETLGVMVTAILLWFGGKEVLLGHSLSAEDFVRFLTFLFITFQPFKSLGSVNNTIQGGMAAAQRVFSLLDITGEPLGLLSLEKVPSFNRTIQFSKVHFTYPGTEEAVIRGIDFTVQKGQIVAIVGSSGSGKSTILDLLPRFYDIQSGMISVDGKDIKEFDLVGLRHLFGIVSQETVLFNDTVYNNIAYGREKTTFAAVIDAAKAANAWEFIEKLPHGIQTVIGERGVMLSGGQRQRLSIARALLKNPAILILDEATSALDTESERLVQSAINTLMTNRTALVVAHRLSTIAHADQILVLEGGVITEHGKHDELIKLNKRYKNLYDIQFAPLPD